MTAAAVPLGRGFRRRLARDPVWRRWTAAWLGGSALGTANGVVREALYADRLGPRTANRVSAASLVVQLALYFMLLERRWPLPTLRTALAVGATWALLTVLFELGLGRAVDRKSWSELLADYDLAGGNLWPLVLAWIAGGPAVVRAVRRRRGRSLPA